MGFFSGRLTCLRFKVSGRGSRSFGPEHIDKLAAHAIGKQRTASADGTSVGWIAADHILDTNFDLAKNIINDTLHFALRIDAQAIPNDLLRAYTQVELEGLAQGNPSGKPSARQKREARLLAKERLETEASDGRFLRRKAIPVLWDAAAHELMVGTTSVTALDRLYTLFKQTFDHGLEMLGSGRQAFGLAEVSQQTPPPTMPCRRSSSQAKLTKSPGFPTKPTATFWETNFCFGFGTTWKTSRIPLN